MKGFAHWYFLGLTAFGVFELGGCSKRETAEQATPAPIQTSVAAASIAPTLAPNLTTAVSETSEPTDSVDSVDSVESEITATETPAASDSSMAEINQDLQELEARVDTVFLGGWQSLGRQFSGSTLIASTDLREQPDRFVVRVYGPNLDTSKVQAKVEGSVLHVSAPGTRSEYGISATDSREETLTLSRAIETNRIKVDRKGNLVVITVPKATSTAVRAAPASVATPTDRSTDWSYRLVETMREMQERMGRVFHDAFPNDVSKSANVLRHGSSVDVDDQKDRYVIHFCLPDRDLKDVNVRFKEGQLGLIVEEPQPAQSNGGDGVTTGTGKYEQMITLSQPVKEGEMKVERSGSTVTVTLPKA